MIDGISAALKPQGFAKRGTAYRHLSGGNAAIIEIQRSQSSNNQVIRFSLNVGVIAGRLLDGFARKTNAIPISLSEIPVAALSYPIPFTTEGGARSVAVGG